MSAGDLRSGIPAGAPVGSLRVPAGPRPEAGESRRTLDAFINGNGMNAKPMYTPSGSQ